MRLHRRILCAAALAGVLIAFPAGAQVPLDPELKGAFLAAAEADRPTQLIRLAEQLLAGGPEGEHFLNRQLTTLTPAAQDRLAPVLASRAHTVDSYLLLVQLAGSRPGVKGRRYRDAAQAMARRLRAAEEWGFDVAQRLPDVPDELAEPALSPVAVAGGEAARRLLAAVVRRANPTAPHLAVVLEKLPPREARSEALLNELQGLVLQPRTDPEQERELVAFLGRSGSHALPQLVEIFEAVVAPVETVSQDPEGLRQATHSALVQAAGGIDHGGTPEAWREWLAGRDPTAVARREQESRVALRVLLGLWAACLAVALAAGALFSAHRWGSALGVYIGVPLVPLFSIVSFLTPLPKSAETLAQLARPSEAARRRAERETLLLLVWDYLALRQDGAGEVTPALPPDSLHPEAREEVRDGRALIPFLAGFREAEDLVSVKRSNTEDALYLILRNDRAVRGALRYQVKGGKPLLADVLFESVIGLSRTERQQLMRDPQLVALPADPNATFETLYGAQVEPPPAWLNRMPALALALLAHLILGLGVYRLQVVREQMEADQYILVPAGPLLDSRAEAAEAEETTVRINKALAESWQIYLDWAAAFSTPGTEPEPTDGREPGDESLEPALPSAEPAPTRPGSSESHQPVRWERASKRKAVPPPSWVNPEAGTWVNPELGGEDGKDAGQQ